MGYNALMSEPLDRDFKIRIPIAMYEELERLAAERGPGSKIAPLIREAIYQVYGGGSTPKTKSTEPPKNPPTPNGTTDKRIGFHAKKNGGPARTLTVSGKLGR